MVSRSGHSTPGFLNAIVYTDYENIYEFLRQNRQVLMAIDFFRTIKKNLRESKLNIVDFIVYTNFQKQPLGAKQQTLLSVMGIETRSLSNHGKASGDLELTVDAARTLYKNPLINVFVIISTDRDITPLLQAIKSENKYSYLISFRNGFNQSIMKYVDFHRYLEDIFNLTDINITENMPQEWPRPL